MIGGPKIKTMRQNHARTRSGDDRKHKSIRLGFSLKRLQSFSTFGPGMGRVLTARIVSHVEKLVRQPSVLNTVMSILPGWSLNTEKLAVQFGRLSLMLDQQGVRDRLNILVSVIGDFRHPVDQLVGGKKIVARLPMFIIAWMSTNCAPVQ